MIKKNLLRFLIEIKKRKKIFLFHSFCLILKLDKRFFNRYRKGRNEYFCMGGINIFSFLFCLVTYLLHKTKIKSKLNAFNTYY